MALFGASDLYNLKSGILVECERIDEEARDIDVKRALEQKVKIKICLEGPRGQ